MNHSNAKRQATKPKGSRRDGKTASKTSKLREKISSVKSNRKLIAEKRQQKSFDDLSHSELRNYVQLKKILKNKTSTASFTADEDDSKYAPPIKQHINHSYPKVYGIDDLQKENIKEDAPLDIAKFTSALSSMHLHQKHIEDAIGIVQAGVKPANYLDPLFKNHMKQLLKVLQNDEDTPQHPNLHIMHYHLTPVQVNIFKKNYPHKLLTPANNQIVSNTPLLDDLIHQFIDDSFLYSESLFPGEKLVYCDIRNSFNITYPNVWKCKPIYESRDICNWFEQANGTLQCNHTVLECDCVDPDIYISIDSIYYFTPHEIALLVGRSKKKLLVASHHVFPYAFGAILGSDLSYLVQDENVRVTIGNDIPKYYNNLHWMRQGSYNFKHKKEPWTMAWKTIKRYTSSAITMFTIHPGTINNPILTPSLFTSALQDESYYGSVNFTPAVNDSKIKNVVGEFLECDHLDLYSWGSYSIMFNTKTKERFYCPKGLVNHMAMYVMGKVRNKESFINSLGHARIAVKSYNIPSEILCGSVFAATCLGFVSHVYDEIKLMHSIVKPISNLFSTHSDAISLTYKTVLGHKTLIAVMAISAAVAKILGVGLFAASLPAAAGIITIGAGVVGAAAVGASYMYSNNKNKQPVNTIFEDYRNNSRKSNSLSYRNHAIPYTTLPSTEVKYTIDQLDSIQIDRTAKIKFGNLEKKRIDHEPISVAGVVTTVALPIVVESSGLSSAVSIMTRPLTPQLVHTVEFKFEIFHEFWLYCNDYFDQFLPDMLELNPKNFSLWNSKFTQAQQLIHVKALLNFNSSPSDRINTCGSFPKIESVIKSNVDGSIKYDPRNIASRDPQHNVVTAPFMHSFSDFLASKWNTGKEFGMVYTSKVCADEIGQYFHDSFDGPNRVVIEGDYKRYDTTIHVGFLLLEIEMYKRCGASQVVIESLQRSIDTVAYDRYGTKFSVDGVRHSGDPNTSCGNTLIQGLATTFALAKCLNKTKPPSPKEVWEQLQMRSMFLGDDSLIIINNIIDPIDYTLLLRSLGLNLEPKVYYENARFYSTFCSARFYPVRDHNNKLTTVLAPPIPRVFVKTGYYVDLPKTISYQSIVKGDALSRLQDSHCIPFLADYWKHIIQILSTTKAKTTLQMKKQFQHSVHLPRKYSASDETWEMLYEVYHLTRDDLLRYRLELSEVVSIPHVLDLPMFHYAMAVDGLCPDGEEYFPQVEKIGFVDVPPCDMTEIPKEEFDKLCVKYLPQMLRGTSVIVDNDIDINNIGL